MRFTPSTLIVTFNGSEEEMEEWGKERGLYTTRVAITIPRYAVEVPFGKEEQYLKMLRTDPWIDRIHTGVIKGQPVYDKRRRQSNQWSFN